MDFDATVQLLIIYSTFAGYLRKLNNEYYSGVQIKYEMGGSCSTYVERRGAYSILVGKLKEQDHLEDLAIDGRVLLRLIFRKWDGGGP